jgi:hypothetical protein
MPYYKWKKKRGRLHICRKCCDQAVHTVYCKNVAWKKEGGGMTLPKIRLREMLGREGGGGWGWGGDEEPNSSSVLGTWSALLILVTSHLPTIQTIKGTEQ